VGKGTGQGLAIAHNVIVQKHGGAITFETQIGVGTTFQVRLPIGEVAAEPSDDEPAERAVDNR
jgi:signal transduction histidine kinase